MASPTRIQIGPEETGLLGMKQTPDAAAKLSELLQQDMEKHNVFYNPRGYHNHISHHLLALYGTGAAAQDIQRGYDDNVTYQLQRREKGADALKALRDNYDEATKEFFGNPAYYGDFLCFYQGEIERLGWKETVLKYLIGKEQNFRRLFSGLLHPYIQLMYGLEWQQPAIVAEGLAQTSVHSERYGDLFHKVDEKAKQSPPTTRRHLVDLYDTIVKEHPALAAESKWEDGDGSQAGVLHRNQDQIVNYLASNISVSPENLEEQIDAMIHASAYFAATAIFHPPHKPKYDFFIIHHLNLTPAFLWLKSQGWIPAAAKARLLEWKLRLGILGFLSRGSPRLDLDALRGYVPYDLRLGRVDRLAASPEELLPRFHAVPDDGHAVKVARALLLAQRATEKYLGRPQRPSWLRFTDGETWLKAHYALIDSVEVVDPEPRWVRSAGFDGAWENIPKL